MMKCQICGRTSLPGAKFCADCRSARKRAFAATVTQPLFEAAGAGRSSGGLLRPSQSMAAAVRRAAERALNAKPAEGRPAAAVSHRLDLVFLIVALVMVVALGAFITHQIRKGRQADALMPVDPPATTGQAAPSVPNAVSVVPAGLAPKNIAETRAPETASVPVAESVTLPPAKPDPTKRANAKGRGTAVEPAVAPVAELPVAPPAVAMAPAAVPVPEVREAPQPDPLQAMQDGLTRCANGNLFDRILCDQRVRREYCEGRWGQVPQCPSGVANDHGQ